MFRHSRPNGSRRFGTVDVIGVDANGVDVMGVDANGVDVIGVDANGVDANGVDVMGVDMASIPNYHPGIAKLNIISVAEEINVSDYDN